MEKVGWIKEWNSDGTKGEYIFPVNECGISVDLNGCQLDFSPKECLHRFPGRSSFHEHILRYSVSFLSCPLLLLLLLLLPLKLSHLIQFIQFASQVSLSPPARDDIEGDTRDARMDT